MVDIIKCTDTVSETDIVRNHCIDIIDYEILGHKLALSLIKDITELLGDIALLAVCSYILDDLTEYAYANSLIYRSALEIETLKILLREACSDELLAVNTTVTYDLMSLLGICDRITDLSSGIDIAGSDTCILDLLSKLNGDDGILLCKDFTIICNDVVSSLLLSDSCCKAELLIDLIDTYSCKIVSSGIEEKVIQVICCNFSRCGIARANLGIEAYESLFSCMGSILLHSDP